MKKEIVITVSPDEVKAAVIEEGIAQEIYIERASKRTIVGNIYVGKVDAVVPGIDAAFIDIGLEKNAYLNISDIDNFEKEGSKTEISQGQKLLVQVVKDPKAPKGARVTTQISIAGKYLVYLPGRSKVGVSRKLSQEERERLRLMVSKNRPKKGGVIIRTAAADSDLSDILSDLKYLNGLWTIIKRKSAVGKRHKNIYTDADLVLRIARDIFTEQFDIIFIDSKPDFKKLLSFIKNTEPELANRIKLYQEKKPLFQKYDVDKWVRRGLSRYVQLKSGGYLVFDRTEALTAVDVNTGKFVGKTSLEETVTQTNIEAAREVVHHLRLRDIGGLIVIDFIDMQNEKNRRAVMAVLSEELKRDRTKTRVVDISPMGLVEMTRKSVSTGLEETLTKICPTCHGKRSQISEETHLIYMKPQLISNLKRKKVKITRVAFHPSIANYLSVEGEKLRELEAASSKKLIIEEDPQLAEEEYRIRK